MTDDELKSLFAALQRENAGMREEKAAAHAETRRHFEARTEAARHEIRLVAESVSGVNEKLDREAGDIRADPSFFPPEQRQRRASADARRNLERTEAFTGGIIARLMAWPLP